MHGRNRNNATTTTTQLLISIATQTATRVHLLNKAAPQTATQPDFYTTTTNNYCSGSGHNTHFQIYNILLSDIFI